MPEYSQAEEVYLVPTSWLKEAAYNTAREQAELLETDHEFDDGSDEDSYGMTANGEAELLGFVVCMLLAPREYIYKLYIFYL